MRSAITFALSISPSRSAQSTSLKSTNSDLGSNSFNAWYSWVASTYFPASNLHFGQVEFGRVKLRIHRQSLIKLLHGFVVSFLLAENRAPQIRDFGLFAIRSRCRIDLFFGLFKSSLVESRGRPRQRGVRASLIRDSPLSQQDKTKNRYQPFQERP